MSARELLQRLTREIAIDSDPLCQSSFSTGDPQDTQCRNLLRRTVYGLNGLRPTSW
jgi:hypothetical protein